MDPDIVNGTVRAIQNELSAATVTVGFFPFCSLQVPLDPLLDRRCVGGAAGSPSPSLVSMVSSSSAVSAMLPVAEPVPVPSENRVVF